ncbi:unnamed protein product [Dovyalis caffra]|uniref:Uncharacterized protein n=1 Tax=Dovyalis caffra TaxID=77055 RepID=A0AAV1RA64_9ROSI|nr:unnamed protein product [Dovyalis caffra]
MTSYFSIATSSILNSLEFNSSATSAENIRHPMLCYSENCKQIRETTTTTTDIRCWSTKPIMNSRNRNQPNSKARNKRTLTSATPEETS